MLPGRIIARLLFLWLVTGAFPAQAATRIWTGAQNELWSNPGNWKDGLVPTHLDSIEFPPEAHIRETQNDLLGREFGAITFTGGGFSVSGNRLHLNGGITSFPGNTTNRLNCDIFVNAPQSFVCFGYFNELGFSGSVVVAYPLQLVTGSMIRIHGGVSCSNGADVTMTSGGSVAFGPNGGFGGILHVVRGTLDLAGQSNREHFGGLLVVGDGGESGGTARVLWRAPHKISDGTSIILNRAGVLDLGGYVETIGLLSGEGVVLLDSGRLTVGSPGGRAEFRGSLRGAGTFRVEGFDGGFVLGGHSSLTGSIQVAAHWVTHFPREITATRSHVILSGSASNAVVAMTDDSILSGSGLARGLTASNATVRPGPGALRFLENFTLDPDSTLAVTLDGPDAGTIQAGLIEPGGSMLELTYQDAGTENQFTVIAANFATPGSRFQGLAEGAWIIAGDPDPPSEFRLTYAGNAGHDVVLERTGWFMPPMLSIRPLPAGARVIEWPVSARGYTLQRTTSLGTPAWTGDGLPAPDATATEFFVNDESSGGERYYRLVC